jgi:hypothetical protein
VAQCGLLITIYSLIPGTPIEHVVKVIDGIDHLQHRCAIKTFSLRPKDIAQFKRVAPISLSTSPPGFNHIHDQVVSSHQLFLQYLGGYSIIDGADEDHTW